MLPLGPLYDDLGHFRHLSEWWPWEMLIVMDSKWLSRIVYNDPNDAASRYSPPWTRCFIITTITPSSKTMWEMSPFQHLQRLYAVKDWMGHPRFSFYIVWVWYMWFISINHRIKWNAFTYQAFCTFFTQFLVNEVLALQILKHTNVCKCQQSLIRWHYDPVRSWALTPSYVGKPTKLLIG